MTKRPTFSILHTSARPHAWRKVYDDWMLKAAHPEDVQYVLCADERWGFKPNSIMGIQPGEMLPLRAVWNEGRRCYVDGVNTAAKESTGQILIVNADDQFACEGWDEKILATLGQANEQDEEDGIRPGEYQLTNEWVMSVSTGTPDEHLRGIMVMPILSRARYERFGFVFYPEYEGMFADADFCEHARLDGVVIEAHDLMFPHRHFMFQNGKWGRSDVSEDAAYRAQMSNHAWELGKRILEERRASGFGDRTRLPVRQKVISICIAGEQFSLVWMLAFMQLRDELARAGWVVAVHPQYTSNVYITRMLQARSVLQDQLKSDYVLWIDDDNIVNYSHVARLLTHLEENSAVSLAAGWCWIVEEGRDEVQVSCGTFSPDGAHLTHFDRLTFPDSRKLPPIEWTGFPCCLMRAAMLEQLGEKAFLPILDPVLDFGIGGEDASFCRRAMDAGFKMIADPRVEVQHVKPRAIKPIFAAKDLPVPKIAAMLRVKNEARWISRVIESLVPLCGGRIFVLDDGSTDNTFQLASEALAFCSLGHVWPSPFLGQPLDEARDKNWMTEQVIELWHPDWILCIDGDEELEPLGAAKIEAVLRERPQYDAYALKFLYLWNSPDTVRVDRWYSTFARNSLFRADSACRFQSLYAQRGIDVHAGLHTGNAPADLESATIQAYLLHYGYMHKEDRIRKYEYYNRIDPGNLEEDCYRHIVQGDIPEVPADAVLKHAGPLELRKLPESLRPKLIDGAESSQEKESKSYAY